MSVPPVNPDEPVAEEQAQPSPVDLLMGFASREPEMDEALARSWLARALARRGHRALVEHDLQEPVAQEERAGLFIAVLVCWSFGAFIGVETGLSWFWWPFLAIGVAIALGAITQRAKFLGTTLAVVALVAWPITLAVLLNTHSSQALATHLVPAALIIGIALVTRRLPMRDAQDAALAMRGVVRGAPLLAPLVLVFLFLPALSSDVWRVADRLTQGRIIALIVIAVVVLLLVVRSQLRGELDGVVSQRSGALSESSSRAALTRRTAAAASGEATRPLIESLSDELLDAWWPSRSRDYVPYLAASERETLLAPLAVRLTITTLTFGLVLTAYIYCLTSVTVPPKLVQEWVGHVVPLHHLHIVATLTLPAGPYLRLAALLGTVATATFLGFVIIEERFAAALTDALLRAPVDRFLGLALPYVYLEERQIEAKRVGSSSDLLGRHGLAQ